MNNDILLAASRLAMADDRALQAIVEHNPNMIREVVNYLRKENEQQYEKLERFETIQSAILDFLKMEN